MGSTRHIVSSFSEDLEHINEMIGQLGALAQLQIRESLQALSGLDKGKIDEVIQRDKKLDALDEDINQKVIEVIAKRAPWAEDLRRVLAAIKISSSLERIGDYAKNNAKRAKVIMDDGFHPPYTDSIKEMGQGVQSMLEKVLDAYAGGDVKSASEVRMQDVEIDRINTNLFGELLALIQKDASHTIICVHLLFVAKNIERIGDYITGIAEQIYFLNEGKMPQDARPKDDKSSILKDI